MKHQLISNNLQVTINALGAELSSVKNTKGLEFIWQANKDIWARHAPNLFPIVGRLKNDSYCFQEKTFQLGQHGFARDMLFDLIEGNTQTCQFRLVQNDISKQSFPFDFIFEIHYQLKLNTLEIKYKVYNSDSKKIWFSLGAHPAFNVPLHHDEKFEDYSLQFSDSSLQRTKLLNGLISNNKSTLTLENKKLALTNHLFDEDALVFENQQINELCLISSKNQNKIGLKCKNWPFFGIWSKKACTQFVCLEPWFGIADESNSTQDLTKKKGIIGLEPQKTFECSYSISFE